MIPRCSPDSARMCDAPLSLNAVSRLLSSQDLSPVTSAFMSGAVLSELNGIDIIEALVMDAILFKIPASDMCPVAQMELVKPHKIPVETYNAKMPEMRLVLVAENKIMNTVVIENEIVAIGYEISALLRCPMRYSPIATPAAKAAASAVMSRFPVIRIVVQEVSVSC